jgi:hypothetical protein
VAASVDGAPKSYRERNEEFSDNYELVELSSSRQRYTTDGKTKRPSGYLNKTDHRSQYREDDLSH